VRIIEKTIRRSDRALAVVDLVPGRAEKTLRWMCGVAGLMFFGLSIGAALFVPQLAEQYQLKIIIIGTMIGVVFVLAAMARRVYRSVERASIRSGTRWAGLTRWAPKIPTTKNLILDIGRNDDSQIFVTVKRNESETLLSIGPFVDGDQAVKASALLIPGQKGNEEESSPVDVVQILQELDGGPPLAVFRVLMISIFCAVLIPALNDQTWLDAGLSLLIGLPVLVLAVVWIAPGGGVFHNTDDSKSVEFWTRHRFFQRLEYRKSLNSDDAPEFLRRKWHWASLGWLCLIPLYVAAVVFIIR